MPRDLFDENGTLIDTVWRCKECPLAEMGTTRWNWTCQKTGLKIPLNRIALHCSLPLGRELHEKADNDSEATIL